MDFAAPQDSPASLYSSISLCSSKTSSPPVTTKLGFCDISGQPVFNSDKSLVYVGTNRDPLYPSTPSSNEEQYDNTLYAIPVDKSGKLASSPNWCYRAGGNLNDGFTRTPAMGIAKSNSQDILYAISNNMLMAFSAAGTSDSCTPQDPNSKSYKDRSGHPPLWTFSLAASDKTRIPADMPSSPLLSADGNTLYVLSSTGYLYALKTKSSAQ
jgi:hypothetical protein